MTSPENRLTGTPREDEREVDCQTHGGERLLLVLRAQITPEMKSKLCQ